MTPWLTIIIVTALVTYVISETMGKTLAEGFATTRRTDIGPSYEGWTHDEDGWLRDLRYTETFANVQGLGIAGDFCRAVSRIGHPESLHIACALATRDGMDTLEYHSKTVAEGFQMSRDDYWRTVTDSGRTDYCRILPDATTGFWFAGCAVSTSKGIGPREIRDTDPPPYIKSLLDAYDGILTWYRWQDDGVDYAQKSAIEIRGNPVIPSMLKPMKTRGLELNRSADPKIKNADYFLLWGDPQTLLLDQDIAPRQIRAICFWVWLDSLDGARIVECSNDGEDLVMLGVETGGPALSAAPVIVQQAAEVRPDAIVSMTKPSATCQPTIMDDSLGSYVFEIWDREQRLMLLRAPGAAKTNEWQHVTVTTTANQSWWPTWQMWISGVMVAEKVDGRAIPALQLKNNALGKNVRGCIQDFRVYSKPMTETKIKKAMNWSKPLLHPSP
jgi:hypothetical protein